MSIALRVEHLSKTYETGEIGTGSLVGDWSRWWSRRKGSPDLATDASQRHERHAGRTFKALDDVTFEAHEGEVLGILGRNGAGKSTLLKVLSQVTAPTSGLARVRGRVSSLLEVGTGFHQDLSGRDNIFLNGAILGMTRADIRRRFDEIVAFSECEGFIDTPVKRYSSGMYVRLAFAVAAHLEPEVLIVDEILAVGDARFQKKCLGKLGAVAAAGRTVLFVSHNMATLQHLCHRGLLLDGGRIVDDGPANRVIRRYLNEVLPEVASLPLHRRVDRTGNGSVRLISCRFESADGVEVTAFASGDTAEFVFGYETSSNLPLRGVDVGISFHSEEGRTMFVLYNSYKGHLLTLSRKSGYLRCRIPRLPLVSGRYRVGARICVGGDEADHPRDGVAVLQVEGGDFYGSGHRGCDGAVEFLADGHWHADA